MRTSTNGNGALHWPEDVPKELRLALSTGSIVAVTAGHPEVFEELGRMLLNDIFLPALRAHKRGTLKAGIDAVHHEITSMVAKLDEVQTSTVLHIALWQFFSQEFDRERRRVKPRTKKKTKN
jgi:hypothetical protein